MPGLDERVVAAATGQVVRVDKTTNGISTLKGGQIDYTEEMELLTPS